MTNTARHAQRELEILSNNALESDNRPIIEPFKKEIIALCERFGKSGQSGGSAPFTAQALSQAIKKLLLQETICPIMGLEDEWVNVSEISDGRPMYQNKREGGLFKDGKDGVPYYVDAIIKRTDNGNTWHGSFWMSREDYLTGNTDLKISPKAYIKSFPFEPKTFYIDVIEEEVAKDDWEMYIKDHKQLKQVWEYYDKF
jgi:hypothetical protein